MKLTINEVLQIAEKELKRLEGEQDIELCFYNYFVDCGDFFAIGYCYKDDELLPPYSLKINIDAETGKILEKPHLGFKTRRIGAFAKYHDQLAAGKRIEVPMKYLKDCPVCIKDFMNRISEEK